MAEFDIGAWKKAQSAQAASDRKVAKKIAALDRKSHRGGGGGGARRARGSRGHGGRASRSQAGSTGSKAGVALLHKKHAGARAGDPYAEKKAALLIDTNMLSLTSRERAQEWDIECQKAPTISPDLLIQHISLSRPAEGDMSALAWLELTRRWLHERGATGAFVCYLHNTDTPHPHLHLIYSRVQADGSILSDSWDYYKGRDACQRTALALKLDIPAPQAKELQTATSDTQVNATRRSQRRGTVDPRIDPALVTKALAAASSMDDFTHNLHASGLQVQMAEKNGRVTGIMFKKNKASEWLSGSSIAREFSLPRVQAQIKLNQETLSKQEQEMPMRQRQHAAQAQAQQAQQTRQRGG